ncbi:Homocysteine S-methyltransferase [Cokeromyces recurvatus]|uniref:Homocysteine S-methyltransferase n=1 Tax=Cokeromyces recurvatus TaxID=90255 RepID=UPI00221FA0DB|nr:Homocysteine S-methyltransferase [Cokeromyces recurvatus]KAI7901810.1 Homocysteine S-methyltransferase [Cokeromyces recurvatus]
MVDFILFETIPSYLEVQAIRKLILDYSCQEADDDDDDKILLPPIAVSFQCRSGEDIADGTPMLRALEDLIDLELVFALGFNCTKPKFVPALLHTIAQPLQHHQKAILAYPDGGEEWDMITKSWDPTTKLPEASFGSMMATFIKQYGPRIIVGGCCGTRPSHIRHIKNLKK